MALVFAKVIVRRLTSATAVCFVVASSASASTASASSASASSASASSATASSASASSASLLRSPSSASALSIGLRFNDFDCGTAAASGQSSVAYVLSFNVLGGGLRVYGVTSSGTAVQRLPLQTRWLEDGACFEEETDAAWCLIFLFFLWCLFWYRIPLCIRCDFLPLAVLMPVPFSVCNAARTSHGIMFIITELFSGLFEVIVHVLWMFSGLFVRAPRVLFAIPRCGI